MAIAKTFIAAMVSIFGRKKKALIPRLSVMDAFFGEKGQHIRADYRSGLEMIVMIHDIGEAIFYAGTSLHLPKQRIN